MTGVRNSNLLFVKKWKRGKNYFTNCYLVAFVILVLPQTLSLFYFLVFNSRFDDLLCFCEYAWNATRYCGEGESKPPTQLTLLRRVFVFFFLYPLVGWLISTLIWKELEFNSYLPDQTTFLNNLSFTHALLILSWSCWQLSGNKLEREHEYSPSV